jgi:ATP-dependent DNA ligase
MTLRDLALAGKLAQNADKKEPASLSGLVMQPKLDGWRLLAEVCEDDVRFYTRTGNSYTGKLPMVAAELRKMFPVGSWLDGEAISADGWGKVQSEMTTDGPKVAITGATVEFVVFDLLASANIDARSLPHAKRRSLLHKAFAKRMNDWVSLIPEYEASDEGYAQIVAHGGEGVVFKNPEARYASGKRGYGWNKRKHKDSLDAIIMGFEDGTDVGAIVFGQYMAGKLVQRGTAKRKPNLIPDTSDQWIGTVVEIEHNGVMESGAVRHPRMLRLRPDKPAGQCEWELIPTT